jgi:hypothetical protein
VCFKQEVEKYSHPNESGEEKKARRRRRRRRRRAGRRKAVPREFGWQKNGGFFGLCLCCWKRRKSGLKRKACKNAQAQSTFFFERARFCFSPPLSLPLTNRQKRIPFFQTVLQLFCLFFAFSFLVLFAVIRKKKKKKERTSTRSLERNKCVFASPF